MMNYYQHKLTADVRWDVGDVLVIDVSPTGRDGSVHERVG